MLDQASQLVNGETHVVLTSTIERLALAAALGGIIGLERELRHKAAGLRTNMLICFGSAMFTVLSAQMADRFGGDNVRIASQIIPGIGFIGAGAILRERGSVTGLTTAATIFVAASVGMAAGAGFYITASFATVVILLALAALGKLERHFERKHRMVNYEVTGPNTDAVLAELDRILSEKNLGLRDVHAASLDGRSRVVFAVKGLTPGDATLDLRLHQSSVFMSVQSLGDSGRE
jgi:putative Mg2+ transporter-C (MgtC) family protein